MRSQSTIDIELQSNSIANPDAKNLENNHENEIIEIPTLSLRKDYPKSYLVILKESALGALSFGGILFAFNTNIYISGVVLSHVSEDTLAANSLITNGTAFICFVLSSPLTAMSVNIAYDIKANKTHDDIARIVQAGWILATLCYLPGQVLALTAKPILLALKQPKIDADIVQSYFSAFSYSTGLLSFFLRFSTDMFITGLNKRIYGLIVDIPTTLLSLGFTYSLVLGKFGMPRLGAKGYAFALAIEDALCVAGYLTLIYSIKKFRQFNVLKPRGHYLNEFLRLLKVGGPVCIAYVGEFAIYIAMPIMAGAMSQEKLAIQSVFSLYLNLLLIPSIALFRSTSILISETMGAKRYGDINRYVLTNLALGLVCPIIATILFATIPEPLIRPFLDTSLNDTKPLIDSLKVALPIIGGGNFFDSVRLILDGALLGMGDAPFIGPLNFIIQVFATIPLMYALGFHTDLNVNGLALAYGIGVSLLTAAVLFRYYMKYNQLTDNIKLENQPTNVNQLTVVRTSQETVKIADVQKLGDDSKISAPITSEADREINNKSRWMGFFKSDTAPKEIRQTDVERESIPMNLVSSN